jgi:hypothetical protein
VLCSTATTCSWHKGFVPQVQVCPSSSKLCFMSYRIIGWVCTLVCVCHVCVQFRAWLASICWLLSWCTALHWGTIDCLEVLLNASCLQEWLVCERTGNSSGQFGWPTGAEASYHQVGQVSQSTPGAAVRYSRKQRAHCAGSRLTTYSRVRRAQQLGGVPRRGQCAQQRFAT